MGQEIGQGSFADLNYLDPSDPAFDPAFESDFNDGGDPGSGLQSPTILLDPATYDSWSGLNLDEASDNIPGFDSNDDGIIDTAGDLRPPPYAVPLQGIQIEIRIYEPTSKSVRTVKIQQGLSGG